MKYLLDTNIVSDLRKKKPDIGVIEWMKKANSTDLYLSCITIAELKVGALKKAKTDKVAGNSLFKWIENLVEAYREQMILVDLGTCEKWAEFLNIDGTNAVDSLLLAQAAANNLVLVTRNTKHFKMFGINYLNPFKGEDKNIK